MSHYYKYPRTLHLPWSSGKGDKTLQDDSIFQNQQVVVTTKMDGENTTMYCDHIHARSIDSKNHKSRNFVKQIWASVKFEIPLGMRICGENLYAKHQIHYDNLPSYFLVHSIWKGDTCLDWAYTVELCEEFGLEHVPILYSGIYDRELIQNLHQEGQEGYVIRLAGSIPYSNFSNHVGKFVDEKFRDALPEEHWMHKDIIKNRIASEQDN